MRVVSRLLVAAACAVVAAPALASGGYYSGTKGARAAGRAGAFAARADDLTAVTFNPAGFARLETTLIQAGNRFSYNAHEYTRAPTLDFGAIDNGVPPYVEFDAVHNEQPWQLLDPLLGVASNLGLEDWGFALFAFAPAGISRQKFPIDGGQRYMMASRDARILDYTASAAWKHGDVFGVGLSLHWIHVPRLRYALVIDGNQFPGDVNPVSSELDMLATVSGSDPFTFNAVLGAWVRPAPYLELGLSAQVVPTRIETDSTLSVEPLSPEIDDEVVLRRDGVPANDVHVLLPLPITVRAGVRYRHLEGALERFDVELDVVYESWSRARRFTVDGDGIEANLLAQRIDVGLIQIEKEWRDTVGVHLGGDYVVVPELCTLRGGVAYESAVAEDAYAHVDFVSGPQLVGALGGSLFVEGVEVAFAYEFRGELGQSVTEGESRVFQEVPGTQCEPPFTNPDTCHPEFLGRPSPPVNAGTYASHSHVASLDVLYRF